MSKRWTSFFLPSSAFLTYNFLSVFVSFLTCLCCPLSFLPLFHFLLITFYLLRLLFVLLVIPLSSQLQLFHHCHLSYSVSPLLLCNLTAPSARNVTSQVQNICQHEPKLAHKLCQMFPQNLLKMHTVEFGSKKLQHHHSKCYLIHNKWNLNPHLPFFSSIANFIETGLLYNIFHLILFCLGL